MCLHSLCKSSVFYFPVLFLEVGIIMCSREPCFKLTLLNNFTHPTELDLNEFHLYSLRCVENK